MFLRLDLCCQLLLEIDAYCVTGESMQLLDYLTKVSISILAQILESLEYIGKYIIAFIKNIANTGL